MSNQLRASVKGHYYPTDVYSFGTMYGPLQCDGFSYLCPDCGGYGHVPTGRCAYCKNTGEIALDDPRLLHKIDDSLMLDHKVIA